LSNIIYRQAEPDDIPALSQIRAGDWGTTEFWAARLAKYLDGTYNPLDSLAPRVLYTAVRESRLAGFSAGHLTRRYGCDGEVQWISVPAEYRGLGIASRLFHHLADWFTQQQAFRICINCDTENDHVFNFLSRHGAVPLNRHWLVWPDIRMHVPATNL
jgi:GNAT superfamily N-acetyltransferase